MKLERIYGIPIFVLIALIVVIASDYCNTLPIPQQIDTFQIPQPFSPMCDLKNFKPEAPEMQKNNPTPINSNLFYVNATGTSNASASPSPSFDEHES